MKKYMYLVMLAAGSVHAGEIDESLYFVDNCEQLIQEAQRQRELARQQSVNIAWSDNNEYQDWSK